MHHVNPRWSTRCALESHPDVPSALQASSADTPLTGVAVLACILVFVGVSTLAAAALASAVGFLSVVVAASAPVLGATVALYAWRVCRSFSQPSFSRPGALDVLALVAFTVVSLRHFLFLYSESDGLIRTLSPNNYGDLPLHLTYVSYFVKGARFWPANPIFTGETLHYPFGIDLFTAMLVKLGLPVALVLPAMGVLGSAALGVALYAWGRGFAVGAFLFSGGLGGFQLLWTGVLKDYQAELAWKNLFLTLFVPQRGFLYALPAGLLLLWSWRRRLLRKEQGLPSIVEGLLWGALPLFHIHSFLFVSVVFAVWALAAHTVRIALPTFLWAVLPATWCVVQLTSPGRAASFVWLKPGWLIERHNALVFLAVNFGLFLALAAWGLAVAVERKSREHLLLLVPALGSFALLFFVMLAPAEWDNTKLMVWAYLLMLPALSELVLEPMRPALRAAAWVVLFFSGTVCVAASLRGQGFEVVRVAERDEVCLAVAALPPDERVATAPTFNHPVALCGQALVEGYAGHLWSHGISYRAVDERLRGLMMGEPDWRQRAKDLGARYVFWGPREAGEFPGSRRPWEAGAPVIAVTRGGWGALYDLRALR